MKRIGGESLIVLALTFLAIYLLSPKVAFDELMYVSGGIASVEKKKSSGFLISVISSGKNYLFNIPNSKKEINMEVASLAVGENVEVWFDGSYTLLHGSYDVWQLKYGDVILIDYQSSEKTSSSFKVVFGGMFLFTFCLWVIQKILRIWKEFR